MFMIMMTRQDLVTESYQDQRTVVTPIILDKCVVIVGYLSLILMKSDLLNNSYFVRGYGKVT